MIALPDGPVAAVAASAEAAVAATAAELAHLHVRQPFRLNNVALKWIRDSHEDPPGNPTTDCVDLTGSDPYQIGVLQKNTGMAYQFTEGETQPWSWRQMLAALNARAKALVLGSNPTLDVVRITCGPVAGSYDHKRWNAARMLGLPYDGDASVPVWDFFVTRSDGTTVRFHTNLNNNKVEVAMVDGASANLVLPQPPRAGKGRSDGPGTYKRQTRGNYDESVRSSQTHHSGCDGSAVAEPPGLQNDEPAQNDGWRSGWSNDAWSGRQNWSSDAGSAHWSHSTGGQEWGSRDGWQDRASSSAGGRRWSTG